MCLFPSRFQDSDLSYKVDAVSIFSASKSSRCALLWDNCIETVPPGTHGATKSHEGSFSAGSKSVGLLAPSNTISQLADGNATPWDFLRIGPTKSFLQAASPQLRTNKAMDAAGSGRVKGL